MLNQPLPTTWDELKVGAMARLANELEVPASQIAIEKNIAELGIDSLGAVRFAGALEDWLKLEIDMTLIYTESTILNLCRYLAKALKLPINENNEQLAHEKSVKSDFTEDAYPNENKAEESTAEEILNTLIG